MDGLIIDTEGFWPLAEIEAFGEVGVVLTKEDCKETMGFRLNEVVDLWFERQPWTSKTKLEVENRILNLVIDFVKKEGQALPGVIDTIALCKRRGFKLAIASSSPMILIDTVVDKLGIRSDFDVLHSAQNEPFGKPHPAVFITAADLLNKSVDQCVVLEDSFHGVVAGLAAKMRVIAVPDSATFNNPRFQAAHHVIPSLKALEENML